MPNWKKIALSGSNPEFASLTVDGAIEASKFSGSFSGSFEGDGSGLTNISSSVAEIATITDTFTNATSVSVTHNFDTKNVIVQVYDTNDAYIIPGNVVTTDANTVDITFFQQASGRVVVAKGGHLVTGANVSQSTTVSDTFSSVTSKTVTHNFDTKNVIVQVYDDNDNFMIPGNIATTDNNTVDLTFFQAATGRVVIAKGGHLVSGSIHYDNITNKPTLVSSSAQIAADISGSLSATAVAGLAANIVSSSAQLGADISGSLPSGVISSSNQITTLDNLTTINLTGGVYVYDAPGSGSYVLSDTTATSTFAVPPSSTFDFSNLTTVQAMYGNWSLGSFTRGDRVQISDTSNTVQVILGDPSGSDFLVTVPVDGVYVSPIAEVDYSSAPTLSNSNGSITITKIESSGGGGAGVSGSLFYDTTNDLWKIGASGSECEIITTCSLNSHLPSGTISGSGQLPSNLVSGSTQVVSLLSGQDVSLGEVTATKLNTTIVSSSIAFSSGSNIFGDELTDIHQVTGSLNVTGSANLVASQSLNNRDNSGLSFWAGSQAQYDALSSYDSNKLYFIT